jgi:hypothetical protein
MRFHGMNRRDAQKLWRELGGTIENKRGTGEEVYRHPNWPKPIRANKRNKHAPRAVTKAIWRLVRRPGDR